MLGLQVALRKMEQQPVHIAAQIAQEAISLQRLRAEAACSAAARDSGRLCNAAQHSMASSQPAAAKVSTKDPPPKTPKFTTTSLCVGVFLAAQSGGRSSLQHALCQARLCLMCSSCVYLTALCYAAG